MAVLPLPMIRTGPLSAACSAITPVNSSGVVERTAAPETGSGELGKA